jgi:hypothetical protein
LTRPLLALGAHDGGRPSLQAATRPFDRTARLLFWLTALLAPGVFWLAPHPPMVDLPQHAGQVMLWRELLAGTSPWGPLFQINLLTPYLVGYGLALPLGLLLPIAAALKLLLTIAYVAFVSMCVQLRRQFGGDPRLDWLFLPGFFGLAYAWGFVTFLVAAPLGLAFIWAAARHARGGRWRTGLALVLGGVALLFSHGLVFVFACLVGFGLQAEAAVSRRSGWREFVPYLVLGLAAFGLFLVGRAYESRYPAAAAGALLWDMDLARIPNTMRFALGTDGPMLALSSAALLASPWLLGARLARGRLCQAVPLLVAVLLLAVVPHFALNTAFLYQRFALFLLPAYAWAFVPGEAAHKVRGATVVMLIAVCWASIAVQALRAWRFAGEAADFGVVLRAVEPRQRALSLVFDASSPAARNGSAYLHFAAWYQAEKSGLVDFNFAWFRPQIVRFRPDQVPAAGTGFEWAPLEFDWRRHHGADYRYFFVRHTAPVPPSLFRGADCPPVVLVSNGAWTVYERRACPR